MSAAKPVKAGVDAYYAKHQVLPSRLSTVFEEELLPIDSSSWQIALEPQGLVVVTFKQREQISGKTIVLAPSIIDGKLQWTCDGGTLQERFRPKTAAC